LRVSNTTRRPLKPGKKLKATPELVALFVKGVALREHSREWEDQGGKRREYLDTCRAMRAALGRKPWEAQILDTVGYDKPPSWMTDADHIADWLRARDIGRELERAMP